MVSIIPSPTAEPFGQYEGFVEPSGPRPDGMWHLVRLTDFSHPGCKRLACDALTRGLFRGRVVQEFLVTRREAQIIHRGSM